MYNRYISRGGEPENNGPLLSPGRSGTGDIILTLLIYLLLTQEGDERIPPLIAAAILLMG